MPQHIKWVYGTDPTGTGFFCPALEQKRRDYFALKVLRPAEAEAVYQCRPGAKIGSIFVEADFRYYDMPMGLELGRASPSVAQFIEASGGIVAQGWDTAMSAQSSADWSACVTVLLVPCEKFHHEKDAIILKECDQHFDVYVLEVYRDKLEIGDLALKIKEQSLKWAPEKIIIEKKASGTSAIQALATFGLPIEGVVPQENKRDRAVNGGAGAGSVQGWFRAGRVLFPQYDFNGFLIHPDWLAPFTRELKDFTGEKGGTDDQVDAMVHVVSYGIREGGNGIRFPTGWETADQVDANMVSHTGMNALGHLPLDPETLITEGFILDPFADTCSRCRKFDNKASLSCTFHKKKVAAIYPACEAFDDGTAITFPRF